MVALLIDIAYDALVPLCLKFLVDEAIIPKDWEAFVLILSVLVVAYVVSVASAVGRDLPVCVARRPCAARFPGPDVRPPAAAVDGFLRPHALGRPAVALHDRSRGGRERHGPRSAHGLPGRRQHRGEQHGAVRAGVEARDAALPRDAVLHPRSAPPRPARADGGLPVAQGTGRARQHGPGESPGAARHQGLFPAGLGAEPVPGAVAEDPDLGDFVRLLLLRHRAHTQHRDGAFHRAGAFRRRLPGLPAATLPSGRWFRSTRSSSTSATPC